MPSSSLRLPWQDNTTSLSVAFCHVDAVYDSRWMFAAMAFGLVPKVPKGDWLTIRRSPSLTLARGRVQKIVIEMSCVRAW